MSMPPNPGLRQEPQEIRDKHLIEPLLIDSVFIVCLIL